MSGDDVGGWVIFGTAFQIPLFMLVNGSARGLILIDAALVLTAVIFGALVHLLRARQEKAAEALHAELTLARERQTARPRLGLTAVPPLAAGAFVVDAEREVS